MDLIFTKGSGKYDELVIDRGDGAVEKIACPKQGIIPHDMVHYAVEGVLAHRGFLSLVKAGEAAAYTTGIGGDSEEAIERLVETFQAEMWGGRVPADDLLATYHDACAARGHEVVAISADDIDAIRVRLDDLTSQWTAIPPYGSLTVRL